MKNLNEAAMAAALGYDYLEVKGELLWTGVATLRQLERLCVVHQASIEVMTSPLPHGFDLRFTGPDADRDRALHVFSESCNRAASLDVGVVVVGCGKARAAGDGVSYETAFGEFATFVSDAATCCERLDMLVAIETLNTAETNLLNTTVETRRLVDLVNRDSVNLMIDYYHVARDGLTLQRELDDCGVDRLIHIHTAGPDRRPPTTDTTRQIELLRSLAAVGYCGRISIECDFPAAELDMARALRTMKTAVDSVSRRADVNADALTDGSGCGENGRWRRHDGNDASA